MNDCHHCRSLLVGLLDGELTPDEVRETNDHLMRCAACRAEHERLRQSSGHLEALSYQAPGDVVLARVWKRPYSRATRNASLALIIGGYLLVLGYGLVQFLTDGREALPAKIGVAALVVGFLTLLLQLIRERVQTYRTDPYKDIER
jgi:anti-sigma factor RsiW